MNTASHGIGPSARRTAVSEVVLREPHLREVQRFTQPWLWGGLIGISIVCGYAALQIPLRAGVSMDLVGFIMLVSAAALVPLLFAIMRLVTEVRDDGIYVRFVPFHLRFKRFGFDEIEKIAPRRYSPIAEYGGWGIRLGFSGWSYNVKGNIGIQIVRKRGGRVLIGTQQADKFMESLRAAGLDP